MGLVCFACLWKHGLCAQTPQISLLELIRSWGLDLDCLRIVILSLAHIAHFLATSVLTTLIELVVLSIDVTKMRAAHPNNDVINLMNSWLRNPKNYNYPCTIRRMTMSVVSQQVQGGCDPIFQRFFNKNQLQQT